MVQDYVFLKGEGDQWFWRNQSALTSAECATHDPVLKLVEMANLAPKNALEIGASNGYRLHFLHSRCNCRVTAIEPSWEAIQDGQARYPDVAFLHGVASNVPVEPDGQFDLVMVNFVLHWIDRFTLLRSVAEIDRMLQDGGHLIIGDFFPTQPEKVSYHHLPDASLWTYKQNYAGVFLASNLYDVVAFLTYDHATHQMTSDVAPENRAQVALLRKDLNGRYRTAKLET